ncbi:MAG: PEP-CTERM sorting domain-containing protein, partial [Isosphaeraceae bacterium]
MPRMRSTIVRVGLVASLFFIGGAWLPARADLIRPKPGRTFPEIAGDIVGTQRYTYDPGTKTGTFDLINAPHLISLGPRDVDLVPMQPEKDGTLTQS